MIDNWISEGSAWITESTDRESANISIYSSLSWSFYIELPDKLQNLKLKILKTMIINAFFGFILEI